MERLGNSKSIMIKIDFKFWQNNLEMSEITGK